MGIGETSRQKKVGTAIQQELALMLQETIRNHGASNVLLSVTKVDVTIDLALAKIYLSIFPKDKADTYLKSIKENSYKIRHDMSQRMKNQLRRMPEFSFYTDNSLDYVDSIENALKQPSDPLKDAKRFSAKQKNKT